MITYAVVRMEKDETASVDRAFKKPGRENETCEWLARWGRCTQVRVLVLSF